MMGGIGADYYKSDMSLEFVVLIRLPHLSTWQWAYTSYLSDATPVCYGPHHSVFYLNHMMGGIGIIVLFDILDTFWHFKCYVTLT